MTSTVAVFYRRDFLSCNLKGIATPGGLEWARPEKRGHIVSFWTTRLSGLIEEFVEKLSRGIAVEG
jgi:hypothetical protein